MSDLIPPQDLDAEKAVLGAMMLDEQIAAKVLSILEPDHFYRAGHQEIYKAIVSSLDEGGTPDIVVIVDILRREGLLEQVGGAGYVSELPASVPSIVNAPQYARIVRDKSVRRQTLTSLDDLIKDAYSGESDTEKLVSTAADKIWVLGQALDDEAPSQTMRELIESPSTVANRTFATGFGKLDRVVKGFVSRRTTVIGGRPSSGKTSLALAIAANQAIWGTRVHFISIEMDLDDVAEFGKAMGLPKSEKLTVDHKTHITLAKIRAYLRSPENQRDPAKVLYLDHISLVEAGEEGRYSNTREQITQISRGLKKLAFDHDVAMVIICQLNREIERREDKTPMMSDLRDSGSMEQDADLILMVNRPEMYGGQEDENAKNYAKIHIVKNKHGKVGFVSLPFNGGMGFKDQAMEDARSSSYLDAPVEVDGPTDFPFGNNEVVEEGDFG